MLFEEKPAGGGRGGLSEAVQLGGEQSEHSTKLFDNQHRHALEYASARSVSHYLMGLGLPGALGLQHLALSAFYRRAAMQEAGGAQ
jgi:hypothetical protein